MCCSVGPGVAVHGAQTRASAAAWRGQSTCGVDFWPWEVWHVLCGFTRGLAWVLFEKKINKKEKAQRKAQESEGEWAAVLPSVPEKKGKKTKKTSVGLPTQGQCAEWRRELHAPRGGWVSDVSFGASGLSGVRHQDKTKALWCTITHIRTHPSAHDKTLKDVPGSCRRSRLGPVRAGYRGGLWLVKSDPRVRAHG